MGDDIADLAKRFLEALRAASSSRPDSSERAVLRRLFNEVSNRLDEPARSRTWKLARTMNASEDESMDALGEAWCKLSEEVSETPEDLAEAAGRYGRDSEDLEWLLGRVYVFAENAFFEQRRERARRARIQEDLRRERQASSRSGGWPEPGATDARARLAALLAALDMLSRRFPESYIDVRHYFVGLQAGRSRDEILAEIVSVPRNKGLKAETAERRIRRALKEVWDLLFGPGDP